MRIQHNIMAMNAYRNYTNNVSAMKTNLEKLSSGYKINRAGDDAAGLAISEKMRAQITGLTQAQANAKSGINLIQTAEGALQEVQDMLNRMVKLAEQSANGTYDDDVDRHQLQKEFNRLREEINRIDKSANFNGKFLFGGPDGADSTSLNDGIETYGDPAKVPTVGTVTPGEDGGQGGKDATAEKLEFAVSYTKDGNAVESPTWAADNTVKIETAGKTVDGTTTNNLSLTATAAADSENENQLKWTVEGMPSGYSATFDGSKLTLTKNATGATTLTKDDYGAVTVTPTNNDVDAGTGTLTVTQGADEVKAGEATGAKNTVTFTGLTGKDVIGDTVKVGTKTYEFVKTGGTAASGNTAIAVGDSDDADALATAFATAVEKDSAYVGSAKAASGVVTVTSKATGASAKMEITATDAGGDGDKSKTELVASTKVSVDGVDLTDTTNKYDNTAVAALKAYFATGAAGEKVKVNDDITVNLAGIADTWAADAKSGEDVAKAMLDAAKGAVNLWNSDPANANKGYTYENVRISTAADDTGTVIAQSAGDGLYILMDKKTGDTAEGRAFTFQVGDTNDDYNKITVTIKSISTSAIKDINEKDKDKAQTLEQLNIEDEGNAGKALTALKGMVNYISDIRGDLGAAQNRLTHTINNLSVMTENIQDAESTIRDTDVADEMMAYTKNNILIQSAQAMLAQANQVPQGVLQLLQ